jgi:D-alanine-D-alanine ligase
MSRRIRVAVLYGGRSNEHPISVVSAGGVLAALDPSRYEVVTLGITRTGQWLRTEIEPGRLAIQGRTLPEVAGTSVQVFAPGSAISELADVDVVFPVLHGAYGEDGTVQGLLEMAGIAYVGSGVLASAAAMDKTFTKIILKSAGLDVGSYVVCNRDQPVLAFDVDYPVFVKPARSGSSVGITKVTEKAGLPDALALAFGHDSKVIIEAAIIGREIECGVLADADGTVHASVPAEIRLRPDFDWYSFEAKYLDDACEFDIPAVLDAATTAAIQDAACAAFQALDCAGLARVDFFLRPDGSLVVNEVNTMPGFTPISMYPKMWAASGVSYAELIDRLIATALAR